LNPNGGEKTKMKNFRMNRKGISPIFATLILIAIAVIAGVVVYMFTSGTLATMTGSTTAAQEKITVQGASIKGSVVTVYLEQTAGPAATINSIIIKDTSGSTVGVITALTNTPSPTTTPTATLAPLANGAMTTVAGIASSAPTVGSSYTLTVTTKAGGNFLSQQVVAAAA